ncbi:MAG: hypothetical protein ACJ746_31245 [Bryobacteraceae bacterium]
MDLIQGHQLRRILVQNVWKVVGAFSLGIVAVVGAGLMLSDVHRIPQGKRSARVTKPKPPDKTESIPLKPPADQSQPVQIIPDGVNVPSPIAKQDDNTAGAQVPPEMNLTRPSRARQPSIQSKAKFPDERGAVAYGKASAAPPVPVTPLIAQTAALQNGGGPASLPPTPATADPRLTLTPETPIAVRLAQQLSTKKNRTGEVFRGTLAGPLTVKGIVVAEAGAPVLGRIVEARSARLFRGGSNLNLELTDVGTTAGLVKVKTTQWYETGSHSRVVTAAMLPGEAAKKVAAGVKADEDGAVRSSERPVAAEAVDTAEKNDRKGNSVNLPSGSEIVFKLLQPLTVAGKPEQH